MVMFIGRSPPAGPVANNRPARRQEKLPEALVWLGLFLLGLVAGAYGTIIGAGGGFVLLPALVLLYPSSEPAELTAISLGVVWFNATSGSVAYARQRRVDYVAAAMFAAATVPGAIAGALTTGLLPRETFQAAFGALLLAVAMWLLLPRPVRVVTTPPPGRYLRRLLTDGHGDTYRYSFDPYLGVGLGLVIGFVASLFGVGGGIMYVPAMILLMRFPGAIATATSTLVLMFTAGSGAAVHLFAGDYAGHGVEELSLALGAVLGAQVGALLSLRLARFSGVIPRLLSVALVLVGLRLVLGVLL